MQAQLNSRIRVSNTDGGEAQSINRFLRVDHGQCESEKFRLSAERDVMANSRATGRSACTYVKKMTPVP